MYYNFPYDLKVFFPLFDVPTDPNSNTITFKNIIPTGVPSTFVYNVGSSNLAINSFYDLQNNCLAGYSYNDNIFTTNNYGLSCESKYFNYFSLW